MFLEFPFVRNFQEVEGQIMNVGFIIDLERYSPCFAKKIGDGMSNEDKQNLLLGIQALRAELEDFAEKTARKFASFRVNLMASIIKKYCQEITSGKISDSMKIKINNESAYLFIPSKEKISILIGFNFVFATDNDLAKLFFREIEDAKYGIGGGVDVNYLNPNTTKLEFVEKVDSNYTNYKTGFISFGKYYT